MRIRWAGRFSQECAAKPTPQVLLTGSARPGQCRTGSRQAQPPSPRAASRARRGQLGDDPCENCARGQAARAFPLFAPADRRSGLPEREHQRERRRGRRVGGAGRLDRIDAPSGMIVVDQQVIVVDRRPILASPKTSASRRDVPMPAFVLEVVNEHCEQLGITGNQVLCRTPRGGLLRRDYYNREIWKPALTTAGLPSDTTFHDLRHTFASTALAEGVPISEVSRWLGHKSITTTVDLYAHLVPEASGRARDALDRAFGQAGGVRGHT